MTKLNITLAVLCIACSAFYFGIRPLFKPVVEPDRDERVLEFDKDERLVKVEIDREGENIVVQKEEKSRERFIWRLVKPMNKIADTFLMEDIFFCIKKPDKDSAVRREQGFSLKALGLESPKLKLTITTSKSRTFKISIGDKDPFDKEHYYFRVDGDDNVYRIFHDYVRPFDKRAEEFRSKQIIEFDPYKVNKIEAEKLFLGKDAKPEYQEWLIVQEKGNWDLVKPFIERLDSSAVSSLLSKLLSLKAHKFHKKTESNNFGLDKALFKVKVYEDERPMRKVIFSQKETEFYIYLEGDDEIVEVELQEFGKVDKEIDAYRDKTLFKNVIPRFNAITGFEIYSYGNGEVLVERDGQKWALRKPLGLPGSTKFDENSVNNFVMELLQSRIDEFYDDLEKPLVDVEKPELRLTFHFGNEKEVYYFNTAEKVTGYRKKPNGKYDGYKVVSVYVYRLRLLELNFVTGAIFELNRDKIKEVSVEIRPSVLNTDLVDKYKATYSKEKGWISADDKVKVISHRMEEAIKEVLKIEAHFVSRIDTTEFKKVFDPPEILLSISLIDDPNPKILLISRRGDSHYRLSRLADSPITFWVFKNLADNLKEAIIK